MGKQTKKRRLTDRCETKQGENPPNTFSESDASSPSILSLARSRKMHNQARQSRLFCFPPHYFSFVCAFRFFFFLGHCPAQLSRILIILILNIRRPLITKTLDCNIAWFEERINVNTRSFFILKRVVRLRYVHVFFLDGKISTCTNKTESKLWIGSLL